jgi:hypothetical protein
VPTRTRFLDSAAPDDQAVKDIPPAYDEDAPGRWLLAHDLVHIVWDEDGEEPAPPPG